MSLFAIRQPLAMAVSIGINTSIMPIPLSATQSPSALSTPMPLLQSVQEKVEYRRYVDAKSGISITYPASIFTKSDESTDQFTKFISLDHRTTFYLISMHNHQGQNIDDLAAAAEAAFAEEKAVITYRRKRQDWFVLSGFISNNIFYRKTILSNGGQTIGTFQINFPKDQKPFYYDIVERMSWSFKP